MKEARETASETRNRPATSLVLRWQSNEDDGEHGLIISPDFHKHPASQRGSAAASRRKPAERVFRAKRKFSTPYLVIKRWMDFCVGAVMLTSLIPVFLVIAIILRASGSPVFFSQMRVGKSGQLFECYKFRTMKLDAERELAKLLSECPENRLEWFRSQKLENDPRITRFGRFLRTSSLDELPQFINVLRGEMSLVGPRPIVPNELTKYGPYADHYLSVKPGLTGLWQISGRNNTTYHRRVALDVAYARNASLGFDFNILLRSTVPILTGQGAR